MAIVQDGCKIGQAKINYTKYKLKIVFLKKQKATQSGFLYFQVQDKG